MNRRTYLASACGLGLAATAGCSALPGDETLTQPVIHERDPGSRTLVFGSDGSEVGKFGTSGRVDGDHVHLPSEIWHRDGMTVDAIRLVVWMPDSPHAEIALAAPVSGDASPPPEVALGQAEHVSGRTISITDLDDLSNETIRLGLLAEPVRPASVVNIDVTLELTDDGIIDSQYTLSGTLELRYPELA